MEGENNNSTEEYVRSIVVEPVGMMDLMAPAQDGENEQLYGKFCGALAFVLGLPSQLVGHVANLDYIEVPSLDRLDATMGRVNYIQLLTVGRDTMRRDAIEEVLCYLTYFRESLYDEPYQHSEPEKKLLRHAIQMIAETHRSARDYFAWASVRLWRDASYLATHYVFYLDRLEQRIQAFIGGKEGYVFDQIANNKVVYCR